MPPDLLNGFLKNWPQLLLLAGLMIAYILFRRGLARSSQTREKSSASERREMLGDRDRNSPVAEAPTEVLRWQVEMYDLARDLKAELETKQLALQVLLSEIKAERQRLEEVLARAEKVIGK